MMVVGRERGRVGLGSVGVWVVVSANRWIDSRVLNLQAPITINI